MKAELFTAIDKSTEEPVDMTVCLRSEKNNLDKKKYKIIGYIKNHETLEDGTLGVSNKMVLVQINGNERKIVSYRKLIYQYVKILQ